MKPRRTAIGFLIALGCLFAFGVAVCAKPELPGGRISITTMAFSPDDRAALVGYSSGELCLWDLQAGRVAWRVWAHYLKKELVGPSDRWATLSVGFSKDGKLALSTGEDGRVCLWDRTTGKAVRALGPLGQPVPWAAFLPDGKRVLFRQQDAGVMVWDVATGRHEQVCPLKGEAALSPDARVLALDAEVGKLVLWDLQQARLASTILTGQTGPLRCLAFSGDGRRLLSGSAGSTKVWSVETGRHIQTLKVPDADDKLNLWHPLPVLIGARFSSTGRFIIAAQEFGPLRVYEVATGRVALTFGGAERSWTGFALAGDCKRALTCRNAELVLWDATSGEEIQTLAGSTPQGGGSVYDLSFSPDGKYLLALGFPDTLWEVSTGKIVRLIANKDPGPYCWPCGLAFSSGRMSMLEIRPGNSRKPEQYAIVLSEALTGRILCRFPKAGKSGYPVAFSPDGKRALSVYPPPSLPPWDGTVSPNQSFRLWDTASGKVLRSTRFATEKGADFHVAFGPGDNMATTWGCGRPVKIWNLMTGEVIGSVGKPGDIYAAAWTPDGRRLLTGGRLYLPGGDCCGCLTVWDLHTGKAMAKIKDEEERGLHACVAITPDGLWGLAGNSSGPAALWDLKKGQMVRRLGSQGVFPTGNVVAFSPDGKLAAVGCQGPTVKLWHVPSCRPAQRLVNPRSLVPPGPPPTF